MSQRNRREEVILPPRAELRSQAHSERHRIHTELHLIADQVSSGVEPDDVDEPGPNWKPIHHHDAEIGRELDRRPRIRHWKSKFWKRRSTARRQRTTRYLRAR